MEMMVLPDQGQIAIEGDQGGGGGKAGKFE